MSTIGWAEALPSDASAVGRSPREIQSLWTAIGAGLSDDGPVYWPPTTSVVSIGACRPSMYRIYYGAKSLSSNDASADTQARAYFASDASQLYTYMSNGTYRVGSRGLVEYQTAPVADTTVVWQQGTHDHVASGAEAVTFPTAFAAAPTVVHVRASNGSFLLGVSAIAADGFTSTASYLGPGAAGIGCTVTWSSIGTIGGAI
jgi:hypothetical protein